MNTKFKKITKANEGFQVDEYMRIFDIEDGSWGAGYSMVRGELKGLHSRRVNRVSTKSYFLLDGSCEFRIGSEIIFAESGDHVSIKPDTEVEMIGDNCNLLIMCSPPFDFEDEEIFD